MSLQPSLSSSTPSISEVSALLLESSPENGEAPPLSESEAIDAALFRLTEERPRTSFSSKRPVKVRPRTLSLSERRDSLSLPPLKEAQRQHDISDIITLLMEARPSMKDPQNIAEHLVRQDSQQKAKSIFKNVQRCLRDQYLNSCPHGKECCFKHIDPSHR